MREKQAVQHQHRKPQPEYTEARIKYRMLQNGNIIIHQWISDTHEWRYRYHQGAHDTECKRNPGIPHAMLTHIEAPYNASKAQEPDQNSHINVYDQGSVKKVYPGNNILKKRRSGKHDKNGKQTADNERAKG